MAGRKIVKRRLRDGSTSERWYAKRWNGRRRALACTGTSDAREATRIARAWENEDARRRAGLADREPAGVARCKLSDAIRLKLADDVRRMSEGQLSASTFRFYQEKSRRLLEGWGDVLLSEVTASSVDAWVRRRLLQVARTSVTKELTTLRQVLATARQAGLYVHDPRAVLPLRWKSGYTPGERWMPMAEADALLAELKPKHAAMVSFALAFAASPGPVERATWADWRADGMLLRDTKNAHRWRRVPVLAHAQRYALGALWYLQQHGSFPGWRDQYRARTLRPACERAGIEPVTLTDCRRSACHWMLIAGIPEHVAARYMGHASSTMVRKVYGRATSGEALAELLGGYAV